MNTLTILQILCILIAVWLPILTSIFFFIQFRKKYYECQELTENLEQYEECIDDLYEENQVLHKELSNQYSFRIDVKKMFDSVVEQAKRNERCK